MNSNNHYNQKLKSHAKHLRNNGTKAEACLWKYCLRAGKAGANFKRQRPISYFIVDFICLELKLIIEVDGITHSFETTSHYDHIREHALKSLGFKLIRFTDDEVLTNINGVYNQIVEVIQILRSPPPTPLHEGESAALPTYSTCKLRKLLPLGAVGGFNE